MVKPTEGWIGVDFDGTIADYSRGWQGATHVGAPIEPMRERVMRWLAEGRQVKIFTARCWPLNDFPVEFDFDYAQKVVLEHLDADSEAHGPEAAKAAHARTLSALDAGRAIAAWCEQHLGRRLPITCIKDMAMVELYDDRCVQVIADTGHLVGKSSRGIPA